MIENSGASKFTAGHPKVGGRRKGTKNQLTTDFIAALSADFRKHGASVIEAVRIENPTDYVKLLALLVAKWGESGDVAATQINVITGVPRTDLSVASRPLLPDGRDPFEEHGNKPAPRPARPVGKPACAEPVQHRLYELDDAVARRKPPG